MRSCDITGAGGGGYLCCEAAGAQSGSCPFQSACCRTRPSAPKFLPPGGQALRLQRGTGPRPGVSGCSQNCDSLRAVGAGPTRNGAVALGQVREPTAPQHPVSVRCPLRHQLDGGWQQAEGHPRPLLVPAASEHLTIQRRATLQRPLQVTQRQRTTPSHKHMRGPNHKAAQLPIPCYSQYY